MRHVQSLNEASLSRPADVAIGVFDGVHLGHQRIIQQLTAYARTHDHVPVVLTFHPSPQLVLHGYQPGYYLTLPDAKARILGELGIEIIVTHPFDNDVRQIRAGQFVGRLIDHLKMARLWVGPDFAMGFQREGTPDFLRREAHSRGFEVEIVDLLEIEGERVSSTRIREAVFEGNVADANRMMGRRFEISGEVTRGAGRGRGIGIPTANLALSIDQALPARGVYVSIANIAEKVVEAVVNIGTRPTFEGADITVVEAHLLDFNEDVYGKTVKLSFIERLRDERKFDGVESLVKQIHADIGQARSLLEKSGTSRLHMKQD